MCFLPHTAVRGDFLSSLYKDTRALPPRFMNKNNHTRGMEDAQEHMWEMECHFAVRMLERKFWGWQYMLRV
jgi:hypothetical protein